MKEENILIEEHIDMRSNAIFVTVNRHHIGTIGNLNGTIIQLYFN